MLFSKYNLIALPEQS